MTDLGKIIRGGRLFLAIAGILVVAACSNANKNSLDNQVNATPGTPQHFVVTVGDRVFFTTDSASLNELARSTLDKQAEWLNKYSNFSITIEGHADERGTREYNIALGARRAAATKNYLVSRGVAASRMRTISFGKERPVAVCDDISCWSQNRRAVTVLNERAGS